MSGAAVGAENEVAPAVGDMVERNGRERLDELRAPTCAHGVLHATVDDGPVADAEGPAPVAGDGDLELPFRHDHHLLRVLVDVRRHAEARVVVHPAHEHTEQVMVVTEGELELTVAGQGTRTLGVGDWAVINRGVEHSVRTQDGAQFIEALAPVPLDHVPDRDRDLVLGPDGGSGHVPK